MNEDLIAWVKPSGPLPDLVGSRSGTILIMGCAACIWDDLDKCRDEYATWDRMALSEFGYFYEGPIQHAACCHPEVLRGAVMPQEKKGRCVFTHSLVQGPYAQYPGYVWPFQCGGGLTGPFGVLIALLMGYDKIILAGCPSDLSRRFYDRPGPDLEYTQHGEISTEREWLFMRDNFFHGKVESLSGNTKLWLGEP